MLKLPPDVYKHRRENKLCFKCGKSGHGINKCRFNKSTSSSSKSKNM